MHWSGIYLNYKDTPHEDLNTYSYHLLSDKNLIKEEGLRNRQNHRWKTLEDNLSKNKENTILEFGGNIGQSWQSLTDVYNMDYYIVERKTLSDHGNKVFGTNNFYDHVPTLENLPVDNIDIVYTREAMQYPENWKEIIIALSELKPQKIIFEHLCTGNIKDFWTVQYCDGHGDPWHFFNFEQFNAFIQNLGYNLIFSEDEEYDWPGRFKGIDEEKYCLRITKNLVYEKI
jgi:putative methyltransferase (TIGR04325 family)